MKTQQNNIHQLETIFFSALDALRGVWRTSNATSVLFSLVFFRRMLALCKEGHLSFYSDTELLSWSNDLRNPAVSNPKKVAKKLIIILTKFSSKNELFQDIFNPFITALKEEHKSQYLIQIILMLEEIDFSSKNLPIRNFGSFFNSSLLKVAHQAGKKGRKYTTPNSINSLLADLANTEEPETVYDPTTGHGSTLLALATENPHLQLLGQEQNLHTWVLCRMNLIANGIYNAKINHGNSLLKDSFSKQKIDIAIAHFPFGSYLPTFKIKNQSYLNMSLDIGIPKINCSNLFIQLMLSKLSDKGRLLTILPIQALTSDKDDRKLREFLVRRDYIEAIITLPFGMLQTTRVPICILVINKAKRIDRREHIIFINGANIKVKSASKLERKITENQIYHLSLAYHYLDTAQSDELQNCVAKVPLHEIILNEYNLDAKSYASPFISRLQQLDDLGQLIQLKNIFRPDMPSLWFETAPNRDLAYVRVQDLRQSISNYKIIANQIPKASTIKQIVGQLVNESVLLVNRAGKNLLIAYFDFEGEPILVNENIMTFRIDTNRVNIEYLLLQLFDDLFLQQLDMYKLDYQHKSISEKQFEELKINLPVLAEQNTIVKEKKLELLKAEERKVEQLRQDLNLGKQKAQSEQYKIISSLQHELGNRLPAILTEFKNLKDYLKDKEEEQSPIDFQEPIFPVFEGEDIDSVEKLTEVVERIESVLVHSINTLDATSEIIKADRGRLKLEKTNLKTLLQEVELMYQKEDKFEIQIEVDEDEKGNELLVETKVDKTQITTAINNLIDNARRHGFVLPNKKYTILFQLGIAANQQEIILIYKNDGKPFPVNFSFEDFISYGNYAGKTGHSGIGGFLIYQIIENHNGHINYRKNISTHDPFKVQFEITLPIIN